MNTHHFPKLFSGKVTRYPVARIVKFRTNVTKFLDRSEQRFRSHVRIEAFMLQFRGIKAADRDAILSFFAARKGRFSPDWDIDIDESPAGPNLGTITDCHFIEDTLSYSEEHAERYTLAFGVQQIKAGAVSTSDPGVFPALGNGARFQRPYRAATKFLTAQNNMPETSYAYSAALWDTPALSWELPYSLLIPTDLTTLEHHFTNAEGRYKTFPFTAPDGSYHSKVRYATDELEIQYAGPNEASTVVTLEEVP